GSVLEGSIRKAGNRVRITAQLINTADGAHIWADRYDRELTDIFAVQDEVTKRIVDVLRVTLSPSEEALLRGGSTDNPEAHDYVLRARELLLRPDKNRQVFEAAVDYLNRAIKLDPKYSDAYAALGMAYNLDYHNRWSGDPDSALKTARECVEKAIEVNPKEPFGHYVAAVVYTFFRDLDRAAGENEKTLALSPNYGLAFNSRGVINIYRGE